MYRFLSSDVEQYLIEDVKLGGLGLFYFLDFLPVTGYLSLLGYDGFYHGLEGIVDVFLICLACFVLFL